MAQPRQATNPHFDPLQFLCKQVAGDFNGVFGASGETVKDLSKPLKISGSWDRSAKYVLHHISGECPEKTELRFFYEHDLVHIIPEARRFSSELIRGIVILDMTKFFINAINSEKENESCYVRLEGDLYSPGELLV